MIQEIFSIVKNYRALNNVDLDKKELLLNFLTKYREHAFDRANTTGHITVSSWLVNSLNNQFLLVKNKKLNKWVQPGGHADKDLDIKKVALKEAYEETGLTKIEFVTFDLLDIDILQVPKHNQTNAHVHYDFRFLLRSEIDEKPKISSDEILDVKFFNKIDPKKHDQSIISMYKKWKLHYS